LFWHGAVASEPNASDLLLTRLSIAEHQFVGSLGEGATLLSFTRIFAEEVHNEKVPGAETKRTVLLGLTLVLVKTVLTLG
jgi:hypothetical protein